MISYTKYQFKNSGSDFFYSSVGLYHIHNSNFIHRDLHSGNILYSKLYSKHPAVISDLGISKSSTESTDNDNIYGIIPYIAPEIFLGQEYTTAADIYSFGMIMWELLTGRKPFWDQDYDADLIIKICDDIRHECT
ncbi:6123_t:CDS:2 [Funneliformis geosporum]|uniref:6123_t:CDS:1 n=1 Tax=Funneliformis geosporum TaxID=1117311 RepID=A0A9W4SMQ8_9GLOM|nr:6123_t:CDS:2 [Funneliformis geosporum]